MKAMQQIANQLLGATITGYTGKNNSIVTYKDDKGNVGIIDIMRHHSEDCTGMVIDFLADSGEIYSQNNRIGFIL